MEINDMDADITMEHSTEAETHIQENINRYYHDQQAITLRLEELDNEQDIETILQTEGAIATIAGVILGVTVSKKWLALPLAVSVILLTGTVKGLSGMVRLLRKYGYRTRQEIEKEKYALKAVRGDFKYLIDVPNAVWNAVNK